MVGRFFRIKEKKMRKAEEWKRVQSDGKEVFEKKYILLFMTVINDNVPVFLVQVRLYINATFKISRSIRAFELTESGREISLPSGSFVKFQLPMDLR